MRRLAKALVGVALLGLAAIAAGFGFANSTNLTDITLVEYGSRVLLVTAAGLLASGGMVLVREAATGGDDDYRWW